ncbi:MAG: hypothetical protein ACFB0E_11005 [Leptolyngbyaceae cyanobacterium]
MQSKDLYARLELLSPEQVQSRQSARESSRSRRISVRRQLGQWGAALWRYFTGSQQPHITMKWGLDRQPFYQVYDPVDHRRHIFSTEHEVRVWLEQRYYQ